MKILFWVGSVAIFYTYAGYPAWLWLRSCLWPKSIHRAPFCPFVSVALVARNEEVNLPRKLANLQVIRYPSDQIEFIVLSDGSSDSTAEILRQQAANDHRLRVIACPESRGKAAGLNECIDSARGEIVFFTDARQQIEPDGIRLLIENFADSTVGCASGQLMLGDPSQGESNQGTGLYWRIEKQIRRWESASGSVVGATGAIYGARRSLLVSVPPGTILDDVYLPMHVARQGFRVVFDERARAWDLPNLGEKREFSRKVRTLTGNYQLLQLAPWIFGNGNPLRFEFFSHKFMRLIMPLALMIALVSAFFLQGILYRAMLIAQLGIYLLALLRIAGVVKTGVFGRLADAARTFVLLNAAAATAFFNWISGRSAIWTPVKQHEAQAVLKASQTL